MRRRSIHSTAERGLSAPLSGPMADPADRRCLLTDCMRIGSLFASLARLLAYACLLLTKLLSDLPADQRFHSIPRLCLLACLLASIEYGLTGALSLACLKIFPCLSTIALYGAAMGSCGHCVISPYAHAMPTASSQQALPLHSAMHETGITGMATETVSGRFETFCQADGMNAQPERSERFKTGFRRFALEWGDQAASASTSLCCS